MNKRINVYNLQANISKVLEEAEKGEVYEIMRYSKLVAVLISHKNYFKLKGECKDCIQDLRKLLK